MFVLYLFQICGNFISPLRFNTLSFLAFSLQNFASLPGVSFYFALHWCACLIHLRLAGPQVQPPFEFSWPTVSGTSPLHLARLCFPSWCVKMSIGSERRLISLTQSWGLAGDAYSAIPLYTVWILYTIAMSRLLLNLQSHNTDTVEDEEVDGIRLVDTHSTCLGRSSSFTAVNSHQNVSMVGDIEKADEGIPLSHRKSNSQDECGWLPNFPYLHHDQNRDGAGSIFTAPYASSTLIPPSLRTARSSGRRRPRKYKPRSAKPGRLRVAPEGDTTDLSASYDEGFTTGSGGVTSGGEWSEVPMDSQERHPTSTLARNATNIKRDITEPSSLTFDLSTESRR